MSDDLVFHDIIVLYMQHTGQFFAEDSQYYQTLPQTQYLHYTFLMQQTDNITNVSIKLMLFNKSSANILVLYKW